MCRDTVKGLTQREKVTPYIGLSDEELAYVDRSMREGITMETIMRELGYQHIDTFRKALRRRGFQQGRCLVKVSGEREVGTGITAEEAEYLILSEAFSGKRRATVFFVARLLKMLVRVCDLYIASDLPEERKKR